jgi:hypothetical protein
VLQEKREKMHLAEVLPRPSLGATPTMSAFPATPPTKNRDAHSYLPHPPPPAPSFLSDPLIAQIGFSFCRRRGCAPFISKAACYPKARMVPGLLSAPGKETCTAIVGLPVLVTVMSGGSCCNYI